MTHQSQEALETAWNKGDHPEPMVDNEWLSW